LLQIDERVAAASGPHLLTSTSTALQGELLEQEYDRLSVKIPSSLVKLVQKELRQDTVVYLNDEKPSPFTLRSSILNRFSVYLLLKYGGLRFRTGKPVIKGEHGGLYRVEFGTDGELVVDEVVVRYGPESAVGRFLPRDVVEEMTSKSRPAADRTGEPHYGEFLRNDNFRITSVR
jgi:hypothetical protein